ncbi:MAG: magnesium transporter [Christensenellales bacterium]
MKDEIIELVKENKFSAARKLLLTMNAVDIAVLFEEILDEEEAAILIKLFRMLPKSIAADVFANASSEQQMHIVTSISDREMQGIMDELYLDDVVDMLEEMPANVVKKVLRNTDEETRKNINTFLNYPEDSAGSIMTIEYVDLKQQMTVQEALRYIKQNGVDKETINTCYVIAEDRKLLGAVSIRKIILSDDNTFIKDIMDANIISIRTHDDQEHVSNLFRKYSLLYMPVVDNEDRLVGIITVDDIVDVIEEETTEDFQKMAALNPSEEMYMKTGVFVMAKNRIVWLLILMISATFTGMIIQQYSGLLSSMVILAAYIPMLMDTGGNSGSQTSTLVIRGMALEEIHTRDIMKVLWKEFRVSLIAGFVLAVVNLGRVLLIDHASLTVALVVCSTLFCTVIVAKLVGATLPILAKKLGADPAIMASPMLTTIVDAVALFIYFGLASMFMSLPKV